MAGKSGKGHQSSPSDLTQQVRFRGTGSTAENQIEDLEKTAEEWQAQISPVALERVFTDSRWDTFAFPGSSRVAQGEDDKLSVAAGGCCPGSSTAEDVLGQQQATDGGGHRQAPNPCRSQDLEPTEPSAIATASAQVTFPGYSPQNAPTGLASNTMGDANLTSLCGQSSKPFIVPVAASTLGYEISEDGLLATNGGMAIQAQADIPQTLVTQNQIHTGSDTLLASHACFVWSDRGLFPQNLPPVQESAPSSSLSNEQQQSENEEMIQNSVPHRVHLAPFVFSEHGLVVNDSPPIQEIGPDVCGAGNVGVEDGDDSDDEEEGLEDDQDFVDLRQARQLQACLRCQVHPREVILLPCSHKVVCFTCFLHLCNNHQGVWPCLVCNFHFQEIRLPPDVVNRLVARRRMGERARCCWKGG